MADKPKYDFSMFNSNEKPQAEAQVAETSERPKYDLSMFKSPEEAATAVTPEELNESESLAEKAYRLTDVGAEGLTRGWKSELQSGIENVAAPYYFGREVNAKDFAPFLKDDAERADDAAAEREGFERYEPSKQEYQKFTDTTKKMMPRLSYAAEVGTSLLPYLAVGPGAGIVANTALGGVEGAVTAGGYSENAITSDEFKDDVKFGAGLGAGLGAAGTTLMKFFPKATTTFLAGAAATPLVTGTTEADDMALGGLITTLVSKGKINPLKVMPQQIQRIWQLSKEGVDFNSPEGANKVRQALTENAEVVASTVDNAQRSSHAKEASKKIVDFYQHKIDSLGNFIVGTAKEKDVAIRQLTSKVWKDLETHIGEFQVKNPNKVIDVGDALEQAANSLRNGMKEVITDPTDLMAAEKTIGIINNIGKIKDQNVQIKMQEALSPTMSGPKQTSTVVGANSIDEAAAFSKMSPEELQTVGFDETTGPMKFTDTPESTTSFRSDTTVPTQGENEFGPLSVRDQKIGPRGDILEEGQMASQADASSGELDAMISDGSLPTEGKQIGLASQKTKMAQQTQTNTRVFEKLFPGKSDLMGVTPSEFNEALVKLNAVIRNSKSDVVKRSLREAKGELMKRERQMLADTGYEDVTDRRKLYGALKDFGEMLKGDKADEIFSLMDDMVKSKQEGKFQDYDLALNAIKKENPELGSKLENIAFESGPEMRDMLARKAANPKEKFKFLEERGTPLPQDVKASGRYLGELDTMGKFAGGLSDNVNADGQRIPQTESFNFVQDLGDLSGSKFIKPERATEMKTAVDLIRKHNPEAAKQVEGKMSRDAEIARLLNTVQGKGSIGFIPTTTTGAVIKGAQAIGLPKIAAYGGKAMGNLERKVINPPAKFIDKTFEKVKSLLNSEVGSVSVPPSLEPLIKPLQNAAGRGDSSLRATIYMLTQQYPELREYLEQLNQEEK